MGLCLALLSCRMERHLEDSSTGTVNKSGGITQPRDRLCTTYRKRRHRCPHLIIVVRRRQSPTNDAFRPQCSESVSGIVKGVHLFRSNTM